MSNPNKNYNPESQEPTLADVLQLQAAIEAVPEVSLRDLNPTERIAVNRFPHGQSHSEGTMISHISLSQRQGDTSQYATAMNYMVLRDGDETTTRLIKRPPFEIGRNVDPSDVHAVEHEIGRAYMALAEYNSAQEMGMYDVTANEVRELTDMIEETYSPEG